MWWKEKKMVNWYICQNNFGINSTNTAKNTIQLLVGEKFWFYNKDSVHKISSPTLTCSVTSAPLRFSDHADFVCLGWEKNKNKKNIATQCRSYLGSGLGRIHSGERSSHCERNTITERGDFLTYSPQVSTLGRLALRLRMLKGQRASAQQACQNPEPLLAAGV